MRLEVPLIKSINITQEAAGRVGVFFLILRAGNYLSILSVQTEI